MPCIYNTILPLEEKANTKMISPTFKVSFLFFKLINLFIFGCVRSLLLCAGFL